MSPGRARSPAARALVVGGGLAGTAAALALADRGARVTLVESRPRLGGLAFSFPRTSPVGNLRVDNGQHVHLRCCTAYRWLLDRLDVAGLAPLQRRLDVPVWDAQRRRLGRIRRTALPAPLHLAPSLARYPHLTPAERLSVARAALALRRLDPHDPALDAHSFADWLRRHGQSARCVDALWDLVGVATLNARVADVSLGLAAMIFRTGLLTAPGAADIGVAQVPLGDLHDVHTRAVLGRAGVTTWLRARAHRLRPGADGTWQAEVRTGPGRVQELTADTVVLAVPPRAAYDLLPAGALPDPARLLRLGTAPILNVHVVYDRTVLRRPFLAAFGSPIQWVFDRTGPAGLAGTSPRGSGPQYVAVSQSAAEDEIDEPVSALRARYLPELERLLPAARDARVRDFFVTRERTATFVPSPGVGRLRPGPVTGAPGLYVAGSWTATGWPATMEGAVRSGLTAAEQAVGPAYRPVPGPGPRRHDFEETE